MDETQNETMQETVIKEPQVPENPYSQREKTITKLRKSGIVFPSLPFIPDDWQDEEDGSFVMPKDLTNLDSVDLGRLMTVINNMLSWYGAILSAARIDKRQAERKKTFLEAKARMEIMSDSKLLKDYKAREDKDAFVNIRAEVIEAQEWFDKQEALEIMADQLYKDLDRSQKTVSREISRRGGEWDHHNRESNLK